MFCSFIAAKGQNLTIIDSIENTLPNLSDSEKIDAYLNISNEYAQNTPEKNKEFSYKALQLAEENYDQVRIIRSLILLGNAYLDMSDFDKALEVFFRAKDISTKINNRKLLASCISKIGVIHYYTENYKEALSTMYYAIQLSDAGSSDYTRVLNNYAIMLLENAQYDSSKKYFEQALEIYISQKDSAMIGAVYSNISLLYSTMEEYNKALYYAKIGFEIEKEFSTKKHLIEAYLSIGQIYLNLKNYKEAENNFTIGLALSKAESFQLAEMYFYEGLSKLYYIRGNYKESIEFLNKFTEQKDSIRFNENQQTSQLLRKHEKQKKDNEIIILQKDSEIQALYRNSLIGGFVFVVILSIGLYNRYRFKNKANKELTIAREQADEASQLKTELLGIAAHDLKNPLNSIVGFSRLLDKKIQKNSVEKEFISTITESSKNMLNLINQLLNSSAIETGKINVNNAPVDLTELSNKLVEEFSSPAKLKKQTVKSVISKKRLVVNADVGRLKEVMANLLSNALKYSEYGMIIKVNLKEDKGNAVFEVIDEGPGLTEEDKKKMFGKFQKLSARPTGGESSTGLGLSIAKQLIEMQNGNIRVESEYGKGSTFIISLPIIDEEPEAAKIFDNNLKASDEIKFDKATIIIADDISENRKLIKEIVKKYNFILFEAKDGKELVDLVKNTKPDLVFSDIKMPNMDGIEALKQIKQINKSIPVIAVTAEEETTIMNFGFAGFIKKPATEGSIILTLVDNLEKYKEQKKPDEFIAEGKIIESILNKEKLLETLENEFSPKCVKLKSTLIIDEIEIFAKELKETGNLYSSNYIINYSNKLIEYCIAFKTIELKKTLNHFPEIINKLRQV